MAPQCIYGVAATALLLISPRRFPRSPDRSVSRYPLRLLPFIGGPEFSLSGSALLPAELWPEIRTLLFTRQVQGGAISDSSLHTRHPSSPYALRNHPKAPKCYRNTNSQLASCPTYLGRRGRDRQTRTIFGNKGPGSRMSASKSYAQRLPRLLSPKSV